jgi:predicted lipoprotein with Yx(FWY)xxD motif
MHAPRPIRILALAAATAALLSACGGGDGGNAVESPAAADTVAAQTGAQISTAETSIGAVLVDPSGLTLYVFTDDVDSVSTCFDQCETAWPVVDGSLTASAALGLELDAIDRPDGSTQLRLNGRWPLYTFAGDAAPGDVNGHESGGVWFAVAADGTVIGLDPPATEPTAPAEDEAPAAPVTTELGDVLTNEDGLTLYAFSNDEPGVSNCNDPCSATWPPLQPSRVLGDVAEDRIDIIDRADGLQQVTLDGKPLYTYVDDLAPGDVEGQGVGDVWFAVGADGTVLIPPAVRIGSTDTGDVLIDPEGFTIYTFENDPAGASTCNDPCSSTWPPIPGDTVIGSQLSPGQFGQITRQDGTTQLTWNDAPLYRFVDDENPGDANGILVGDGVWNPIPAAFVHLAEEGAAPAGGGQAPAPTADGVHVANTSLGDVLVNAEGLTLYGFTSDTSNTASSCNDRCATAWPPVPGDQGVDGSLGLETTVIERADGSSQLVIGRWPAYTFSGDAAPGDVNGQGSGGAWFALAPDGSLIR